MIAALLVACSFASAADTYVGLNPIAPVSMIPSKALRIAAPIFSNMEFGLALSGGVTLLDRHDIEGRLSVGSPHGLSFSLLPQAAVGYSWFVRAPREGRSRGPYLGANLRLWDLLYWTSGWNYWSLMPAVHAGWWFDVEPLAVNLRLTQILGACSGSDQPGTSGACDLFVSPAEGMIPILPLLGVDVVLPLGGGHIETR
jgi:hypothetical protein